VIHLHNLYSLAPEADRVLARSGRPVIQTVHDFSQLCPNAWLTHPDGTPCPGDAGARCFQHDCGQNYPYDAKLVLIPRLRLRLLRGFLSAAICPSRFLADLMARHGFTGIRRIPYFVDLERFRPADDERAPDRLLYVGRLDPEKGVEYLLDAMAIIRREVPAATLTVVGDGSRADALRERTARLGLTDAVTFVPRVPHEEVVRHYATATLKILPSIWAEQFGIVGLEAMAVGLPVVGFDVGGVSDWLADGETGCLVRPRDTEALAAQTIRLLRAPEERARMSERARDRAREFTRERNVDAVEALYGEVAGTARATEPDAADGWLDDDLMTILHLLCDELHHRAAHENALMDQVRALEGGGLGRLGGLVRSAAGKLKGSR